jgi:hypothetical protein
MARLTTLQTFTSIAELRTTTGHVLPAPFEWRLLPLQVIGQINGLPGYHGTAVATNGIHVAIMQADRLLIGHFDYFIADEQSEMPALTKAVKQPRAVAVAKPTVDISEFV